MSRITLKTLRENKLYLNSVVLKGNNKLRDYDNPETGESFRYSQFSTRARRDCPFASAGCLNVCYACTGLHHMPSVKANRELAYNDSLCDNFAERMIYTIETEKLSARYNGKHMIMRVHESGDFYSLEYLKKWISVFAHFQESSETTFCFYTKSFEFFLSINETEASVLNTCLANNVVAMSLSLDDTTTKEQIKRAMEIKKRFPLVNIYYCTEDISTVQHDKECDCADCAKCGTCVKTCGKTTVVKIHSANEKQLAKYRKAMRKA